MPNYTRAPGEYPTWHDFLAHSNYQPSETVAHVNGQSFTSPRAAWYAFEEGKLTEEQLQDACVQFLSSRTSLLPPSREAGSPTGPPSAQSSMNTAPREKDSKAKGDAYVAAQRAWKSMYGEPYPMGVDIIEWNSQPTWPFPES